METDEARIQEIEDLTDQELMEEMPLEAIVSELKRRNFPMIYCNNPGMLGRVIFIPMPLEVIRATKERAEKRREEIGRRTAALAATGEGGMGWSAKRQGVHNLHPTGSNASENGERSGSAIQQPEGERTDRMQGSTWTEFGVQPTPRPSTTGTTGV